MSRKRLIPKLQLARSIRNPKKLVVVITKQFGERNEIGDPVSQAKIFQDQSADELIFLNIDGSSNDINTLSEVISQVSEDIFMPLTVGGGVTSESDFRILLANGADKISINTTAVKHPEFITAMSKKFGKQCVVVSIDYRMEADGSAYVYTHCGKEKTELNPVCWAKEAQRLGAGELMVSCIDHDGQGNGIELKISRQIIASVNIPVILGAGCGLAMHFPEAFAATGAEAICAGTFFARRDQNLIQTRSQIVNAGVDIRV